MNLVLSLTEQCNLRCSYCYYRKSQSARSLVMSDDVLIQSIQLAYEMSLAHKQNNFNITFFGGEPLLCKEAILKGVEFAKQLNAENIRLRFAVNTNGTLLDTPTLDFFQKENFRIFLSLDGPQDVHDSARRFPNDKGSFNTIQPFLSRLSKMDSVILRVISRKHLDGLADSIRFIHSLGFKNISTATDFDGHWSENEMDILAAEYQKVADYWVECKIKGDSFYLGTIQDKIRLRLEKTNYRSRTCPIFEGAIAVAANGNIFPCSRFITSKKSAPYILGNVYDGIAPNSTQEIKSFLDSEKEECSGCELAPRCIAHECACTSFYTTGTIFGISAEVCTHERMLAAICDDAATKILKYTR